MAIAQKHREISAPSSHKMNQWKPRKKDKLFRRKAWVTQAGTSYDQGAIDRLVKRVKFKKASIDSLYNNHEAQSSVMAQAKEKHVRGGIKFKRATIRSLYNNHEAQSSVMAQAKEVQAKLSPSYPSLIKVMLPSHVTGGFWLGLPKGFCNSYLPKQDTAIVLEDENGVEYETKYISEKNGLSAGWRGFSMAHKLRQGDVIVLHLVMPNKLMVYIVRSNGAAEVNGAVGLKYEACNKQSSLYGKEINIAHINEVQTTLDIVNSKETSILPVKEEEFDYPAFLAMDIHKGHWQTSGHAVLDTEMMSVPEYGNASKSFGSNPVNGIRLSDSTPEFGKVKSSSDFIISVNGLVIDSEFSSHNKTKYYELCCSQKSFLHDHILEGLNYKLVSGIISEIINIADAIRACKITTSHEHLATWNKTLTAFEGLGMNVGFLRARINQLMNLSLKPVKKIEAELKRDSIKAETSMLVVKILEARATVMRLEAEIHSLDTEIETMGQLFQEVANAPW